MIHTFAGDFKNLFELVATIAICLCGLGFVLVLGFGIQPPRNRKNKKAS